jgi:hypothetical protein
MTRYLSLFLLMLACGGDVADHAGLQAMTGEWEATLTVQPVIFDPTAPPPNPIRFQRHLMVQGSEDRARVVGLCPSDLANTDLVLGGSTETPYWRGRVEGCAVIALDGCSGATFTLESLTTTLRDGEVVGDGSGQLVVCGQQRQVLVYVTASRSSR